MWILLKLILSVVVGLSRLIHRLTPQHTEPGSNLQGMPYFVELEFNNSNDEEQITGFKLGVPLPTESLFKFELEGMFDGFCKSWGLCTEYQTGDQNFDQKIFIACDHPVLQQRLAQHAQSREVILQLLGRRHFRKIWSDGEVLWTSKSSDKAPTEEEIALQVKLAAGLMPVCLDALKQKPPYFKRFLLIETLVWSLFGYAASLLLEHRFNHQDYHLNYLDLLWYGSLLGLLLWLSLMLLIRKIMGKSSTGHTIVAESFFLLMLSMPLCGIQLLSDLNRYADQDAAQQRISIITVAIHHKSRGKGAGIISPRDTYFLELINPPGPYAADMPARIEVTEELYRSSGQGRQLLLRIKPGFLGLPWYEKMTVYPADAKIQP